MTTSTPTPDEEPNIQREWQPGGPTPTGQSVELGPDDFPLRGVDGWPIAPPPHTLDDCRAAVARADERPTLREPPNTSWISTGAWVRRRKDDPDAHRCTPPSHTNGEPNGSLDDLWRCYQCGKLWRVGRACGKCDHYGPSGHLGQHEVGLMWRAARFGQRIQHMFTRPT